MSEAGAVRFSVAICTWNRAPVLRRALGSHAATRVPAGVSWELLVVDNASTDDTAAVAAEFAGRLPLRYVRESTPGLSHARNAAVRAARGVYIVWADDDAFVEPGWLAAYAAAAAERWPEAALFGGPILPHFEPEPPAWLRRALPVVGNAYALLDYGAEPLALGGERLAFGANFVVRAAEQRRHPYAAHLGRVGTHLGAGEETAVISAVLAEGGAGWYVPDARVAHLVPAARQSLAYLRRWYADGAASAAPTLADGEGAYLLGRPRWVWRAAVEQQARYWLTRWTTPPERWTSHMRQASTAWGVLRARGWSARRVGRRSPGLPPQPL